MINQTSSAKQGYNRRKFIKTFGLGATAIAFSSKIINCQITTRKPNVLFIAVDDLRPQLGCYGNTRMISPNIDRLASEGILFERAYCQEPICMASRASLLSGYRPDFAQIYNCDPLEKLIPNALTLNKHFENNGYQIWASGKIYHHKEDHKKQFGEKWINPKGSWAGRGYLSEKAKRVVNKYAKEYSKIRGRKSEGRGPAFESPDVPDNAYYDGLQTDLAIEQLQKFSSSTKPFFMAVGYKKPHLPFNAPKKYWDLYPPEKIKLADNPFLPKNATEFTPYNFGELRNYHGIPKNREVLPDSISRKLIHGYYACVSYIDAQIGRLLSGLEKAGLKNNTIIVLWGDHGWKLGEHGMWCKHTPFELDAHVPMIFSVPHSKQKGKRARSFAEFVDIYPTLCELCGLELPDHLEGNSLVPVLKNPDIEYKKAAFTQWPKVHRRNPDKVITGYSIKTDRYRYTEWIRNKTGDILARELYDHNIDPDENENVANDMNYKDIIKKMNEKLDGGKGWKNFRPKR